MVSRKSSRIILGGAKRCYCPGKLKQAEARKLMWVWTKHSYTMCEKINKVRTGGSGTLLSQHVAVFCFYARLTATAPQVNSWLNSVFGDQKVPCFEVNTRTVDILYHIAESSEARCRDTTLLIEDLKQKTSEYEAEGEGKVWSTL